MSERLFAVFVVLALVELLAAIVLVVASAQRESSCCTRGSAPAPKVVCGCTQTQTGCRTVRVEESP